MMRFAVAALSLALPFPCFAQSFFTQGYPVGSGPAQVIAADFDGDHIPDLATVNNSANTVSILINRGDGVFLPHVEFPTGPSPVGMAGVDWNKDGNTDLAVVNSGADAAHSVSILIGNGDGSFQPQAEIAAAPNANSIAVGDFNHDGNPDIATSTNSPANGVYVNLGDGHGGVMGQKVTSGFGLQAQPGENPYLVTRIAWADFNHDGKDDLYYIECCGGSDVEFGSWGALDGNGDGTFTDHSNGQDVVPRNLVSVDINQDGLSDVMLPYLGCHEPCVGTQVFISNGDGTFRGVDDLQITGDVPAAAALDVEGDGLKDVALVGADFSGSSSPATMTLIIARQNADGSFPAQPVTTPLNAPLGGGLSSAVTGDFNHDGRLDLAFITGLPATKDNPPAGSPTVWVVLNTTPASACRISTTDRSVTVCRPSDGSAGSSPVRIISHAASLATVNSTQVYLDGKLAFRVSGKDVDTKLPLLPGNHHLTVKSWIQSENFSNQFFFSAITQPGTNPPPCSASADRTVNICSPGQNADLTSPIPVVAAGRSIARITSMQIYLDHTLVFRATNPSPANTEVIETDVPAPHGAHTLSVKAWDSTGRNFSSSRSISVP